MLLRAGAMIRGHRRVVGPDAFPGPADGALDLVGRLLDREVVHEVIGIIERGEDRGVGIAAHGEREGGADHRVVALAVRRGGEDLGCAGRRILDVLQRAQYVGGDAGLLLAVNAGTVSRRRFRIELLEFVDQREDLLAGGERQFRRPERRGRVGQPAIWLPRIRVDAEHHALARPGEQFEAAIGFPRRRGRDRGDRVRASSAACRCGPAASRRECPS